MPRRAYSDEAVFQRTGLGELGGFLQKPFTRAQLDAQLRVQLEVAREAGGDR